ncbi:hypothetical protein Poli38472_005142 [Pythium oligandrum]|uniref:CNH domain-containing protein n=1 Tax=Pythium oligandrum TaxID=41045 RepID=A0A8K1CGC6_PYTOL|nr:hypothetical protein Poli38472_005142 [Pythium oligandrum]|eukprot:TMW62524.1 hypothetical protein Poli38472_005142 [Pythium oligandrum]
MAMEPYVLVDVEADKPVKKPQQIDALLSSTVAWGDLAPLVFFGTTDSTLHCYVPAGGVLTSLNFVRFHTTYKKIYHPCARFLDAWGIYMTLVDAKVAMYALPLHTNPHLDGNSTYSAAMGHSREKMVTMEDTKNTVLFAVHESSKVVCTLSKQNTLKVFDWTVNRSLELRVQHELLAVLGTTKLLPPSALPVQRMVLLGESYVLLVFKKEWCVVNLDSGKVLGVAQSDMIPHVNLETITCAIPIPRHHYRKSVHRTRGALVCGKHYALRLSIIEGPSETPFANEDSLKVHVEKVIEYNTAPRNVSYHHPFLLLDAQEKIAVYNFGTMKLVQSVPIKSAYGGCVAVSASSAGRDASTKVLPASFLVASAPFVVQSLEMVSISKQLRQCIDNQQLEEAVVLTELCPDEVSLLDDELSRLNAEYALDLFRRGQFDRAMEYYSKSRVNVMEVLELFPRDLLPRTRVLTEAAKTNQRKSDDAVTLLQGDDLVKSLLALISFLWKYREQPANGSEDTRELVDTVLLKCIVLISEKNEHRQRAQAQLMEMVRSENWCEIGEVEVFLRAHNRFDALLNFYASRKLHRKALELLEDLERSAAATAESKDASATPVQEQLKSAEEYLALTTEYLRRLGHKRAELVFEFSRRVILSQPTLGLSIFTSRNVSRGREDIDPAQIVNHLKSCQVLADPATVDAESNDESTAEANVLEPTASLPLTESRFLAIEYLTQVIYTRKSAIPGRLHDDAVYLMLEAITAELQRARESMPNVRLTSRVSSQRGLLGKIRRKLIEFLQFQGTQYHPERMLSRTPLEMVDERAALLSRLGRHHEVLHLYALQLRDATLAEAYCNRCYETKQADSSIYSTLLRLYLRPPLQTTTSSSSVLSTSPPKPMWQRSTSLQLPTQGNSNTAAVTASSEAVTAAVNILNKYAERIDVPSALELLPPDVPVAALSAFFRRVLERQVERFRNGQVKKQLSKMENFKVRELLTVKRKESVTVWSSHCCQVCGRKLGIGTFVRLPTGALLHYACQPAP